MYLTPTDFVAENVSILVKYIVNNKPKWCLASVHKVQEYGVQNGHHYVDVLLEYDDEDKLIKETLWDYDYSTDTEDAWRFTTEYTPLVDNVLNTIEDRVLEHELDEEDNFVTDGEDSDSQGDDDITEDEDDSEDEDITDEDDSDDEDITDEEFSENESEVYIIRKKPSFLNQLCATLFVFSPLIASAIVIYNAREDVTSYMRVKIC
jgi:hypothetical protein